MRFSEAFCSVERFELVCLHWCLVLVEMGKRVLCAVVVSIIVCIDGLSFQARNGIELLDRSRTESSKCTEDSALDFSDLGVFHRIHQCVLSFGSMILEFLCGVFFTERSNLVEVHLLGHARSQRKRPRQTRALQWSGTLLRIQQH